MATHTRYFRWDDAGAPTLSGTAGSLIELLRACLVGTDGVAYGSGGTEKLAAGWTEEFTGTNVAVFRNSLAAGGTGCYLRVDDTNAQYATINVYASMSDIDTGTGPASDVTRYVRKSSAASSDARPWLISADERTVYGGMYIGATSVPAADGTNATHSRYNVSWGAGDCDPFIDGDAGYFVAASPNNSTSQYTLSELVLTSNNFSTSTPAQAISFPETAALGQTPTTGMIAHLKSAASAGSLYAAIGGSDSPTSPLSGYTASIAINAIAVAAGTLRCRLRGLWTPVEFVSTSLMFGDEVSSPGRPGGSVFAVICGQTLNTSNSALYIGRLYVETVLPWD